MTNLSGANLHNGAAVGPQGEGRESPSSFPAYPAYKDSGVEWLGAVPTYWESWKISHAFGELGSGTTPPTSEAEWYEDGTVPWVTTGELRESVIWETKKLLSSTALSAFSALRLHPAGSLAIAMYGATIGRLGILGVDATTNQACCLLTRPNHLHVKFTFYWLLVFKQSIIDLYASGGGQPNINQEIIANLKVPAPGIPEQTQIARFLDHETARIDALIEEQQRLIELLKEKRQAVISHAVTKGLDPTVPMKDSGVEWLGEVPAHWIVRKGGYIGMLFGSEAVPEDMVNESGNLPFLKVGSLSADTLSIRQWDFFVDPSIEKAYRPRSQFVVFPKRGAAIFLNKVNVVEVGALLDPNLMGWEMETGNDAYYFANVLKCRGLAELADVSTVPQINNKHISPEKFPVPPSGEQHDIVAFLDTEVSRFDQLVTEAENGVSLLIERRSALISAAVTGKIDVRGWQPPSHAPSPELTQEAV